MTTAAFAAAMMITSSAGASSHREAPAIADDPAADNTDLYAWVTPGSHNKLNIVANWIPLEEPSGGPNFHRFSERVLYEIKIARGPDSLAPVVTYQFRFSRLAPKRVDVADPGKPLGGGKEFFIQLAGSPQTMTVTKVVGGTSTVIAKKVPVAPPNIGPRTDAVVNGEPYDDTFAASFITDLGPNGSEGRVWAGPRDDGFYVDLGGIFDLANVRPKGTAQDGVAGFNTHAIVLEIPTNLLTANGQAPTNGPSNANTLGIWSTSSRRQIRVLGNDGRIIEYGPWTQVSRLGLPLVNEAVIGLQDKDKYNATTPSTDLTNFGAYFLNPIMVRDAEAVGIYAALGVDPDALGLKYNRLDIVETINLAPAHQISTIGDVLRVDLGVNSGFPNGRAIPGAAPNKEQADVTDVLLSLILAKFALTVSDGVDYNDKPFLAQMPWLALPHRGYDEGHGIPTP